MKHRGFRPPVQHVISFETTTQRVGPIAYQYTVEISRNRSSNGKIAKVDFIYDGRYCTGIQVYRSHVRSPTISVLSGWHRGHPQKRARLRDRARLRATRQPDRASVTDRSQKARAQPLQNQACLRPWPT